MVIEEEWQIVCGDGKGDDPMFSFFNLTSWMCICPRQVLKVCSSRRHLPNAYMWQESSHGSVKRIFCDDELCETLLILFGSVPGFSHELRRN